MPTQPQFEIGFAKRATRAAALAFCFAFSLGVLAGCVTDPSAESSPEKAAAMESDPGVGANALGDQAPAASGIPRGCTREWNAAAMDSVLYCPDIRPPKPR